MTKNRLIPYCLFLLMCFIDFKIFAGTETPDNRPPSPGISVEDSDHAIDRISLKSTDVTVDINGSIAEVTVRKQFRNNGDRIISGQYTFPAPDIALVHGMRMKTGGKTFTAEVKERKSTGEEFDRFDEQGINALLLEQVNPDLFRMDLANIMPGETVDVEISYTELLIPRDMEYRFVYPAFSDPGFSGQADAEFNIVVNLSAGIPIRSVTSRTHSIDTVFNDESSAKVTLKDIEKTGDNRNYVLNYRLAEQKMPTGLILSGGDDEKFLLLNDYVGTPGLKDISLKFTDLETYDLEPSVVPAILTSRPVTVLGKWKGEADGLVKVEGRMNRKSYSKTYRLVKNNNRTPKGALEHLWAEKRIEHLSDFDTGNENLDSKSEIRDLALKHNLLTAQTSFIAFNDTAREMPAPVKEVKQALPVREEVSKPAPVRIAKVPEPGFYLLVIIMTSVLAAGRIGRKALKTFSRSTC